MKNNNIRIGIVQQSNSAGLEDNRNQLSRNIEECAQKGAQLILLQELHNSLYFCQTEDTKQFEQAESIPGPSTRFYGEIARRLEVVLVCSLFERRAPGLYHNTAVVIERDGSIAGKYRKMHIPDDPGFYEKFYFTPGDLGFHPVSTSVGKLGVLICWDQWYPEAARLMAMAEADLLLYPTAIGWDPRDNQEEQERQRQAWLTIQRSHAIANGLPVISANRVGFEPDPSGQSAGIQFWGSSFICGPQGEILSQATSTQPGNIIHTLDLSHCESVRQIWPFFRDRRIDAYKDINQRFLSD